MTDYVNSAFNWADKQFGNNNKEAIETAPQEAQFSPPDQEYANKYAKSKSYCPNTVPGINIESGQTEDKDIDPLINPKKQNLNEKMNPDEILTFKTGLFGKINKK